MAFPKSLKSNYVVKSLAAAGKHSSELHPFELAIIDTSNYTSLAPGNVLGKEVILAVGSPNQGQTFAGLKVERLHDQLNTTHSFKSQPVTNPKQILTQKFTRDDQVNIYYLGWNGLNNACKSLEFECGKTYQFDIYVKGREVRNIFGREMRQVVDFTTPCCDCTGTDCDTHLNCGLYIDELVGRFNDPNFWLSRFYKAEAVVDCNAGDPVPTPDLITRTIWCLTVCDNGTEIDLANVQNQYPDEVVTVKSRTAPYTTYQLIDEDGSGQPSAFTQTPTVVFDCECPSGWTEVPAGHGYIVAIDDDGTGSATTAIETAFTLTTEVLSAERVSFLNGVSTYYTILDGAYELTAGTDGNIVTDLGPTQARCESDTTSTVWVECDTVYKVERTVQTTVKVPDCGTVDNAEAVLLEDWLEYATQFGLTGAGAGDQDTSDCVNSFTGIQLSTEWLTDGCDTLGWRSAKWDILPRFKGNQVVTDPCTGFTVDNQTGCVTPPDTNTDCCQCGIKFTAHEFRTTEDLLGAPVYDIQEYLEKDAVELTVGLLIPDGQTQVCTDTQPDWWWAQRATFRTLQGRDVLKEVITERLYRQEPYYNLTEKLALLINKREGIKYGVDLEAYYFAVTLSHNVANEMNWTGHNHSVREDCVIFIHEDDAALYDSVVTTLKQAFPSAPIKSLNA